MATEKKKKGKNNVRKKKQNKIEKIVDFNIPTELESKELKELCNTWCI